MALGRKTGGRKVGSKNKFRPPIERIQKAADAAGKTPLEFMLWVMGREDLDLPFRADMAKAAAPYVHAKPTEKPPETPGGPSMIIIGEITDEQRIKALEALITRGKT